MYSAARTATACRVLVGLTAAPDVSELTSVTADLESVFLNLTETAPVAGQARQVDQSVVVTPEVVA